MTTPVKETFSVAIVTRNRSGTLVHTLASLARQTRAPDEVIVIDNASTDATPETVNRFSALLPLRYDRFFQVGVNCARNRAIDLCETDILAYIDDDAVAVPSWIESTMRLFEKNSEATAVVGVKDNLYATDLIPSVIQFSERDLTMARDHDGERVLSPTLVDTCNFAARRRHIIGAGVRFNETLVKGGDRHFGHQLFNAGKTVLFAEDSVVLHRWPSTLAGYFRMRWNAGVARRLLAASFGERRYGSQTRRWGVLRMLGFAFKKARPFGLLGQFPFVILVVAGHCVYLISRAFHAGETPAPSQAAA